MTLVETGAILFYKVYLRLTHEVEVRTEAFECCAVEFFAVIRVSHADHQFSAFLQGFTVQINSTVFGYEPVDVVTGSNNTCTLGQYVRDLRYALICD